MNDKEIEELLKTKQFQLESITARCTAEELTYQQQPEIAHNKKREEIMEKVKALTQRTSTFKSQELSLIRRNKELREQLKGLQQQVARDQAAKFQEWV